MVARKYASPLRCATLMAAALMLGGGAPAAKAATYYWDVNGAVSGIGGTGNWDTSTATWNSQSSGTGGTIVPYSSFTTADTAYFSGGGTVTLTISPSVAGLIFNSGTYLLTAASAKSLTLGASGITLTTGAGNSTLDTNVGVILGANQTWTNSTAASTLTVKGVISGSGGLTLSPGTGGISLLNAASSFTGPLTLANGTLQVTKLADGGVNSTIGAAANPASNLVLGIGTTLKWVGDGVPSTNDATDRLFTLGNVTGASGGHTFDASPTDLTKALRFTNTGTIAVAANPDSGPHTLTFTGTGGTVANPNLFAPVIPDNGDIINFLNNTGVTKDGAGVWKLTGANSFYGPVQILNGTLVITSVGITVNDLSSLGASPAYASNLVIGGGTGVPGTLRFEGSGGTGNLTERLFTIGQGGAIIDASGAPGTPLHFHAFAGLALSGALAHTLTVTGTNTDDNYLNQSISDTSLAQPTSVIKNGTGTWVFKGESSYTGSTTVNAGILRMAEGHTAFGSGPITINAGGILDLGTSMVQQVGGGNNYTTGLITLNGGELAAFQGGSVDIAKLKTDVQLWGKISAPIYSTTGITSLSKSTANTLILSAYNLYTGGTTVTAGAVQVGNNYAFGSTAGQTLVIGGLGTTTLSSASTTAYVLPNNVTFTAGAVLGDAVNTGALTFTGTVDLGTAVRALAVNSAVTFAGAVSGTGGGITKSGTGVLTLGVANTFTGGVTINGGRVRVGNAAALGNSVGTLVLNDTGALSSSSFTGAGVGDFTLANPVTIGGNITLGDAVDNGVLTLSGAVALGTSVTRVVTLNADAVLSGVISGTTANLTKAGTGTLTLSNTNTFSVLSLNGGLTRATTSVGALGAGSLTLAGGNLQLASDTALNFGRNTTVGANAAIIADRATQGVGVSYTLGTLSLGAYTLGSSVGNFVTSGTTGVIFGATTLTGIAAINTDNSLIYPSVTNATTVASLAGNFALTVGGSGNLVVSGADTASSATLTKNGTGSLSFGSTYASSGLITINGGSLVFNSGASLTAGTKPAMTFGGSGLFVFNSASTASVQLMGALSFSAGEGVVKSSYTGPSGNAGLTFLSTARAVGADGLLIVTGGTITGSTPTNKITALGQTANTFVGASPVYFAGTVYPTTTSSPADFAVYDTSSYVRAINWSTDTTLANTVAASGVLTASKANLLNGSSGTSGTVTQGVAVTVAGIKLTGGATLVANALVTTPSLLASGNTYSFVNGSVGLTTGNANDLVVRVDASGDVLTISAPITSTTAGGLTKAGQGILNLTGTNAFAGNIYINAGTLSINTSAYNGADPAGPLGGPSAGREIRINGGTFQLAGSNIFNPNAGTKLFKIGSAGGTIDLGAGALIKLDDSGQLTGGGNLTVTGTSSSTFNISNANAAFTGNVAFNAGTLVLGGVNPLGSSVGQTIVLANNVTALDVQGTVPNTFWFGGTGLSGAGAVRSSATGGTLSGPVYLNASTTFNLANPVTLSGVVTQVGGNYGITKEGNSILTLSGANTFSAGLTINNGAVNLGNTAAAGPGNGAITLNSNAVGTALQLSGGITVYNPLTTGSTNQWYGGINFGGVLENVGGNNTYAGTIGMAIDTVIGSTSGNLTLNAGIQENTKESQLYFVGAGNITLAGTKITASGGSTNSQFYSIQKYGAGTLTITNAQDVALDTGVNYGTAGAFLIRQGTVNLTADATWRSNILIDQGAALTIDHQGTGLLSFLGRLSTAYIDVNGAFQNGTNYNLTLRGGSLTITGSSNPNDTAEYFGSGTFYRGSSVITLKAVGTNATRLKFTGSITNNVAQSQGAGPSGASLLIRGTNLGSSLGDAVLWWNGIITWNGQGGGNDAKNKGIMSWVLVDSTETGMGSSFGTADGGSSYARGLNQQVYSESSGAAGRQYTNEYDTDNAVNLNNNVHLTGGAQITVPASVSPNSLTVEAGTGLTLATGAQLTLQSGGILIRTGAGTSVFSGGVFNQTSNFSPLYYWTLGNLDLVSVLNGGNGVSNGNISAVKAGAGVLALKPPTSAVNGLSTQGTNTLSGQFVINDGTVKLYANNAIQPNNYLALTSGVLDLNGRIQQTYSLFSDSVVPNANGIVTSAVAGAALVVNQDNSARAWSGQIQGATSFIRSGQNTYTLNSAQPFTGAALFNGGTTNLISEAALTGAASVEIDHAALVLDNGGSATSNMTSMKYDGNRLRDAAGLTLRAATFTLYGRANVAAAESIGAVSLASGFNVFNVNNGGNGAVYSEDLLMASLGRPAGSAATLIVQSNATLGGSGVGDVRVKATTFEGGGLTNGIVGGWAINNSDFLTYVVGTGFVMLGNNGTAYDLFSLPAASNPTKNVRLTGTTTLGAGGATVNALSLAGTGQDLYFTNATDVLNLVSGGFIGSNNNNSIGGSVDSGRLTAGGAVPAAPSDLYLFNRQNTMTLNARVIDNPAGGANAPVRLVLTATSGAFNLVNTAATYTGGTVINGGTVNLLASTTGAVIPAATTAANGLVLNGATVTMGSQTNTVSGQIAAANIVTLNGSSNLNLFGNNTLAGLVFNNYGGTSNPTVRTFYNNHPSALGSTGVLTIGAAGITATSQNVGTVATVEGRVDFGPTAGSVTVDPISAAGVTDISPLLPGLSLQAIMGSTGGITKYGNGVLQLTAQSSFTGAFTVSAGGLRNGVLNAGSRYSTLTVASGARYDLANITTTWGGLAGGGDVFNSLLAGAATQSLPTLNVGYNNADTTFSGRFLRFNEAVMFNLSKVGTGTLSLTSAQTTDGSFGPISVLGGTLRYTNAGKAFVASSGAPSSFLVNSGGTLLLDNAAANGTDRLGLTNAGFLAVQGGKFKIAGNAGADTSETIALLKVQSGGGRIELVPTAGQSITLTLSQLSSANNSGTLVIGGINGQAPAAGSAALSIANVPYQGSQGYGQNGTTNLKVRSDILADASATGPGTGFLVKDSDTSYFRALDAATELNGDVTQLTKRENFGLTASKSLIGDLQMNTLTSTGSYALTSGLDATAFGAYGPGGRLLTVGLYNADGVLVRSGTTTALSTGALTSDGTTYFHVVGTGVLNLNSSYGLGGSAGFVKADDGVLNLNRKAYMAPLNMVGGYSAVGSDLIDVISTDGLSIGSLVTGAGIPANSFVIDILSRTRFQITSGVGVTTSGPAVITATPSIQVNGGTLNLNSGADNTLAVAGLAGAAGLSSLFINGTGALVDLKGYNQAVAVLGSTNFLPGMGGTITNSNLTSAAVLTSAGGGSFGGVISGNLAFTRSGNNTTLLTNASTYTGETIVRGGTLQLRDAGTLASTAGLKVYYGAVNWDNYGLNPVGSPTPTRLQSTNPVTLQGGSFILTGGGGTDTVVTLNALTAAGGGNLINMQPYVAEGSSIKLTIGNLVRSAANHATFNLNGWTTLNSGGTNTLGSQGLSNTSNLFFTQLGGLTFNQGALTNNLIGGWAVADGNAFATYTDTFGVVSMGNGWGYSTSFTGDLTAVTSLTTGGNFNDGTSRTMPTGTNAMNSLRVSTSTAMTVTPVNGTKYTFGVGLVTNSGTTVTFEAVDSTNTITGTGSELFVFVNQNTTTLKPIITGSAALVSFGGATLQLAPQYGSNTYSGGTFVNGGTLNLNARSKIAAGGATITPGSSTITVPNSGFTVGQIIANGYFPVGTKVVTTNSAAITVDNPSTATSTVTGQTINSFDGWYAIPAVGGLTISNATVNMSAGVFQQIDPATAITINGGGNLTLANYALGNNTLTVPITQTFASLTFVNEGGAGNPTFNLGNPSPVSGTNQPLSITQLSSSAPITATNNSLSTTPTISTGSADKTELRFGAVSPVITVNSGLAETGPVITVNSGLAETGLVISAVIGQSAAMTSLTKSGNGLLALTGANTFTAPFILNAGGLMLGADSGSQGGVTTGPVGGGTLFINGGYLLSDGLPRTVSNPVTVGGNFSFGGNVATTNLTLSGAVDFGAAARTITVTSAAVTAELAGNITSTASSGFALTKAGPGILKLSGSNTFAADVAVTGGILVIGDSAAIPATSSVQLSAGAGLDLANFDLTIPRLTGGGFVTNSKGFTANLTVGDATDFIFDGVLTDNSYSVGFTNSGLQFFKVGTGKMTLKGANLNTTGTVVSDGILEIAAGGLPGPGQITLKWDDYGHGIFQINHADNPTLANLFADRGRIYHVGAGTTTLTGDSAGLLVGSIVHVYAGGINLGNGTGSTGSLGGAAITVDAGTFLAINHSAVNPFDFTNAVDGAGELRHIGGSVTTLLVANAFTGKTRLNAGTLIAAAADALSATSEIILQPGTLLKAAQSDAIGRRDGTFTSTLAPALTLNGSAVVDGDTFNSTVGLVTLNGGLIKSGAQLDSLIGSFNLAGNVNVTANAEISALYINTDGADRDITVAASTTLTMSGTFSDTNKAPTGYVKKGAGLMLLTGANEQTGTITISAGTLQVGNGGATGTLGSTSIASTLYWSPVVNNAALVVNRAGTYELGNPISGTGTLTNSGAGTVMLTADNTYTGATTISGGILQVGNLGTTGTLGGNAGTYGAVTDNASLVLSRTNTYTLGNAVSGTGTLTNVGSGTVIFTGNNTYAGGTTLAGGTARISSLASAGGTGALGAGSTPDKLVFTGGTLEYNGAGETSQRGLKVADGGAGLRAIQSGAAVVFSSAVRVDFDNTTPAVAGSRPLTLGGTSTAANTFAPALFETETAGRAFSSLTKNNVGTWIIGSGGLFNGDATVNINGGLLGFSADSFGGSSSTADVNVGNGATLRWESGNTSDISARIHVAAGATATLAFADTGASPTVFNSPMVLGSGAALVKSGPGEVVFAAPNSFSGGLTVSGGKLTASHSGALGSTSIPVVVQNTATLAVNAVTANSVTVNTGGALAGTGTVASATVGAAGIVAPGNGAGALTLTSLALRDTSIIQWQVWNGGGAAGVGYDTLNLGVLDISQASYTTKIRIDISSLSTANGKTPGNAFAFSQTQAIDFTFATVQSVTWRPTEETISNFGLYFDIHVDNFHYSDGSPGSASVWSLKYDGANTVTLTAIPEPSTYGLGLGVLGLALAAVRRRRRKVKAV